nr:hypothetical protein Itr_chr11CG13240 [Ipomoea trifida]
MLPSLNRERRGERRSCLADALSLPTAVAKEDEDWRGHLHMLYFAGLHPLPPNEKKMRALAHHRSFPLLPLAGGE